MMWTRICITLIFLGLNAIVDIHKKEIYIPTVIIWGLAGTIWMFFNPEFGWKNGLTGLIPGIGMAALSVLSRGAVGFGDSLLIMITGLYLGFEAAVTGLLWGLIICTLWGILLICLHRGTRNTELAFAPFYFLGIIFWVIFTMLMEENSVL